MLDTLRAEVECTMQFDAPLLFQYVYTFEILAFSICVLILKSNSRSVIIWLLSNFLGIIGSICVAQSIVYSSDILSGVGAAIAVLAGGFKSLSFASPVIWRKSNLLPNILSILACVLALAILILMNTPYRLALISLGGFAATAACIFYLYSNRMWSGLGAVYPAVAMLIGSVLCFLYLFLQAYPLGYQIRFSGPSDGQVTHLILLCMLMFFFHMAFIGLMVARNNRDQLLQLRRNGRLQTNIEKSKQRELLSTALAVERYHLLKMLTHEVRQPLNTAQAALEIIGDQLGRAQTAPETVQRNVKNAQSTLNSIVLSISNSILGATLITEGRPIQLCPTDLCDVSQLVLMDLDPLQRARIQERFEQPVIYTDADPIVLRLAIRNLLENALKYSPSNTSILFELVTDEEKLAFVIRVTNEIIDPSMLNADIFQLNRRGVDSNYEGSGLGLYIVRKVAEMHKGDLGYRVVNRNRVVFELTIPA